MHKVSEHIPITHEKKRRDKAKPKRGGGIIRTQVHSVILQKRIIMSHRNPTKKPNASKRRKQGGTNMLWIPLYVLGSQTCHMTDAFSIPLNKRTAIVQAPMSASNVWRSRCRPLYSATKEQAHDTADSSSFSNLKKRDIPQKICQTYVEYAKRLWKETDPIEREKVASQDAIHSIKKVKHLMEGEEYVDLSDVRNGETVDDTIAREVARAKLLEACDLVLATIDDTIHEEEEKAVAVVESSSTTTSTDLKPKKKSRSVFFGAAMGAIVACWVFSGNFLFTGLFTAMTILGQLEYYRMVMKTGVYPARRISVLGACSMFVTVSTICVSTMHLTITILSLTRIQTSTKSLKGIVLSQLASNMSSCIGNVRNDLDDDHEAQGCYYPRNSYYLHRNVLPRIHSFLLGPHSINWSWTRTNQIGTDCGTNF